MYFVYDRVDGQYDFVETEEEAKKIAEDYLEHYSKDAAGEGWLEDMSESIGYGKVIAHDKETVIADKKNYTDEEWRDEGYSEECDQIVEYKIEKTVEEK